MKFIRYPSGEILRSREFLCTAECWAIRTRKVLHGLTAMRKAEDFAEQIGDADSLLTAIQRIASFGKAAPAVEAAEIACLCESLIHRVTLILDDQFTP